ncbi:unnamed protein product [Urochloa humidicola]
MLASLSLLVLLVCHFHGLSHAAAPSAAGGSGGVDAFIYNGFTGAGLDLDGMAVVEPDGKLMLTNVTSQLKGHAFHPAPLRFHDEAAPAQNRSTARSFSTTFVFAIAAEYVTVSGNGLAFFVAPTKNLSAASPSQFLGLFNSENNGNASNRVFAVELDTILNPEFRDINSNHVGVDVNGLVSVAAAPAGYHADDGGFRNLSLYSGDAMQVWVDYDGRAAALDVTLAPAGAPKPRKPLISVAVDLSAVVTGTAYAGLSSSTGPFRTRHYVLGWSFALGGAAAPPLDYARLPKMPRAAAAKKRRPRALDVALPVAAPLVALAAVACASVLAWRRLRYAELREDWEVEFGPHRFKYRDLFHATGGFSGDRLLGVGGFGRVYRGVLRESKTEVAVKVVSHDARQGMRQFVAEVASIGRLRHRNVVQLLGYCRRRGELLLVYDYMPNGSLDTWLYGAGATLSWEQRVRAIRGVASGLVYLHEEWEQVVIHRDVKASNVLLDADMNARLGDFGLARLYDRAGGGGAGAGPQSTHVVGTMGYLAPELAHTRRVSPATDVFAFGAFVLEVACGRRPIDRGGGDDGRFVLVDWVLEMWHAGALADAADARLRGDFPAEEAELVLMLGLLCSHPVPGARPSMRQVVQYLDGDAPLPEPPRAYRSFTALAAMHNVGFDSYAASYPSSSSATGTSVGDVSSVHSGGR